MLGQTLQAVLMGGAVHHHAIGEGEASHSVGALVFLGLSTYVATLNGKALPAAALHMGAAAAAGFLTGSLLKALNLGKAKGSS